MSRKSNPPAALDNQAVKISDLHWFFYGAFRDEDGRPTFDDESTFDPVHATLSALSAPAFHELVVQLLTGNTLPMYFTSAHTHQSARNKLNEIAKLYSLETTHLRNNANASLESLHFLCLADFLRGPWLRTQAPEWRIGTAKGLEIATAIYLELSARGVEFDFAPHQPSAEPTQFPVDVLSPNSVLVSSKSRATIQVRESEVQGIYQLFLGRLETNSSMLTWRATLCDAQIIADFVQSDEFKLKFIAPMQSGTLPVENLLGAVPALIWSWAQSSFKLAKNSGPSFRLQVMASILETSAITKVFAAQDNLATLENLVGTMTHFLAQLSHRDLPQMALSTDIHHALIKAGVVATDSAAIAIAAMVDIVHYSHVAKIPFCDLTAARLHYLTTGLGQDLSPNPLFDPAWIYERYGAQQSPRSAMQVWHQQQNDPTATPSPFFDAQYYNQVWPDIQESGLTTYDHFIQIGHRQGRACSPVIEGVSGQRVTPTQTPIFDILTTQIGRGAIIGRLDAILWCDRQFDEDVERHRLRQAALASQNLTAQLGAKGALLALAVFVPEVAAESLGLDSGDDPLSVFEEYCAAITSPELKPGPLFEDSCYLESALKKGLIIPSHQSPFTHWLVKGHQFDVATNTWFDSAGYSKLYPECTVEASSAVTHFALFGQFDGRPISVGKKLDVQITGRRELKSQPPPWAVFWGMRGIGPLGTYLNGAAKREEQINALLDKPQTRALLARAGCHEPAVVGLREVGRFRASPYWDGRELARQRAIKNIPGAQYDTLICVPWLRTGGADWIAAQVATAMADFPNPDGTPHKVLVAICDTSHFERRDWIGDNIDCVDLSWALGTTHDQNAQLVLYGLIQQLKIKNVININSRRCFDMMTRFASRLAENVRTFAYYFCWDRNVDNDFVGYPAEYFGQLFGAINCSFVDSDALKDQLQGVYQWPDSHSDRLKTLFTPFVGSLDPPIIIREDRTGLSAKGRRPRVLWAGRLDRQKRFDLVISIAQLLPDYEFLCWGDRQLDALTLGPFPDNLTLSPSYKSFDELPLDDFDVWLFTSAWEGTPTILVELGGRGVPIVASDVGGVSALINSETGWLVSDIDTPAAYVSALHEAMSQNAERQKKANALRQSVTSKHSLEQFKSALFAAIAPISIDRPQV